MPKPKKRSGEKLVFIIIILIFVFSSMLAYSSFTFRQATPKQSTAQSQSAVPVNDFQNNRSAASSPITDQSKTIQGQSMEGVVRQLAPGTYTEGDHYLEASGVTLAILNDSAGVGVAKYVGKDVNVWGDISTTVEGDGVVMKVSKIEEVKS